MSEPIAHKKVAIAIGAHPDDIEFGMAGTLLLLRARGWEIHMMHLANGSCGSRQYPASQLIRIRSAESRQSASLLGACWHPPLVDDLCIFYQEDLLRRVAGMLRKVKPAIVLTHSPQDYMEDHVNTCRLTVTAAFSLGMANFKTVPRRPAVEQDVTVYHAMPHGLRDGLRQKIIPGAYVNTASVQAAKLQALGAHRSQQDWLESSQGMNSYLQSMDDMSRALGRLSRRFTHAEGWRRHAHTGFSAHELDPLRVELGPDYLVNRAYEKNLERGQ